MGHPHPRAQPGEHPPPTTEEDPGDDASEASSSGLPPPIITADKYEALICRSCVLKTPILRKYAGTPDALAVVRGSSEAVWTAIGRAPDVGADVKIEAEAGAKRSRAASEDGEPVLKRMKLEEADVEDGPCSTASRCLAPNPNQQIQSLLQRVEEGDYELFAGDLFLTDDFRDRWCKCSSVRPTTRYPRRALPERDFFSSVRIF